MWLYPEVMPAKPRRRIRWWMYAVLGFAAASALIMVAMPRHRLVTNVDANATRIETKIPTCDVQCERERDEQVRFRRETVARLHALRTRIALTPQPTTGVSLAPACLTDPFAKGCS